MNKIEVYKPKYLTFALPSYSVEKRTDAYDGEFVITGWSVRYAYNGDDTTYDVKSFKVNREVAMEKAFIEALQYAKELAEFEKNKHLTFVIAATGFRL